MITKKLTAYYKNHTVEQTRSDIVEKIMLSLIIFGVVMAGVTGLTMDISNAECIGCDLATPVEKNTPVLPVKNDAPTGIGTKREYNKISYIVIHHTATRDDLTAEEMELSMKRTYINNRGGKVIPTHYIIDKRGNVQRVNSLGTIVGATLSALGNIEGVHIELVGDFNKHKPTEDQYKTLNSLIGLIENEVGAGLLIKGHGDFQPKNCPGEFFDFTRLKQPGKASVGDVIYFDEITAYYTPIETDTTFSHGNFENSRKVNGDFVNAMGWDYKEYHKHRHGACGKRWAFGTVFDIKGRGTVVCVDRGGAIDNNDIDIRYGIGEEALKDIRGRIVHPQQAEVTIKYLPQ